MSVSCRKHEALKQRMSIASLQRYAQHCQLLQGHAMASTSQDGRVPAASCALALIALCI